MSNICFRIRGKLITGGNTPNHWSSWLFTDSETFREFFKIAAKLNKECAAVKYGIESACPIETIQVVTFSPYESEYVWHQENNTWEETTPKTAHLRAGALQLCTDTTNDIFGYPGQQWTNGRRGLVPEPRTHFIANTYQIGDYNEEDRARLRTQAFTELNGMLPEEYYEATHAEDIWG